MERVFIILLCLSVGWAWLSLIPHESKGEPVGVETSPMGDTASTETFAYHCYLSAFDCEPVVWYCFDEEQGSDVFCENHEDCCDDCEDDPDCQLYCLCSTNQILVWGTPCGWIHPDIGYEVRSSCVNPVLPGPLCVSYSEADCDDAIANENFGCRCIADPCP